MKKVLFILTMVIAMFVALTNLSLAQTINACYSNKGGALRYVSNASQCTKGETAISWDQTVPQEVYDALCSLGYAFDFCSTYPPYPPPTPSKIVFVSSQTYTGEFGGVGGGDQKCTALARAAGLSGWYKAWLSERMHPPNASPSTTFTHSATPYVLRDGRIVANDWNQLVSGTLRSSINIDEYGNPINDHLVVWTGTQPDGQAVLDEYYLSCSDWATDLHSNPGAVGYAGSVGSGWTFTGGLKCDMSARIYCFEQ